VRVTLPTSLADLASAGGPGADGRVDQYDLSSFMNMFAANNPLADVIGTTNTTRDGQVTAEDMQAFMSAYNSRSASAGR
jgi:hypothetical protein